MKLLSLFSGCGGMDIGFEGDFKCLKKSINQQMHPDWVTKEDGQWVTLKKTNFDTVFTNELLINEIKTIKKKEKKEYEQSFNQK